MKIKKIIIDILVILLAFVIFVLWYHDKIEPTMQTSASLMKYYTVYLITTDEEYQYWEFVNQGASNMAAAIGVNYVWAAPAERSALKQIEVINQAVEDGANALLVAADDPKKISGAIEDAKARGVKIIYVDSPAYEEAITTLATDNYEAGVIAGQTMLEELKKHGIQGGSIGIISVIEKQNTYLREAGFNKVILADARFKLLNTIYTNGEPVDAQAAAESMINDNKDLVGLFGANEGTSEGVGYANRANNNKVVGIGFDETDVMLQLLNEGALESIMVQNPFTMGYLGMAQAVAAILGNDTGPSYLNTGVTVQEK